MKNYFAIIILFAGLGIVSCNNQTETKKVNDTTVIESPNVTGTGTPIPDTTLQLKDSAILRSDTPRMTN